MPEADIAVRIGMSPVEPGGASPAEALSLAQQEDGGARNVWILRRRS